MTAVPAALRDHPDRLRWNDRYRSEPPSFVAHPLVAAALAAGLPDGPVLELACGRSGSALEIAATGRTVIAVDISDLALSQLFAEAHRRGLAGRVECELADVPSYVPRERFALVLATHCWDPAAFRTACGVVLPHGLLGWEALSFAPDDQPANPWQVAHGELSDRLPERFAVLEERAETVGSRQSTRLLARAGKVRASPRR